MSKNLSRIIRNLSFSAGLAAIVLAEGCALPFIAATGVGIGYEAIKTVHQGSLKPITRASYDAERNLMIVTNYERSDRQDIIVTNRDSTFVYINYNIIDHMVDRVICITKNGRNDSRYNYFLSSPDIETRIRENPEYGQDQKMFRFLLSQLYRQSSLSGNIQNQELSKLKELHRKAVEDFYGLFAPQIKIDF